MSISEDCHVAALLAMTCGDFGMHYVIARSPKDDVVTEQKLVGMHYVIARSPKDDVAICNNKNEHI